MSATSIWFEGVRRVMRAPVLVVLLWLATIATTLVPAFMLHREIAGRLGQSLEANEAADGHTLDWLNEFESQGSTLGRTLHLDVVGFAAVVSNASAMADVDRRPAIVIVAGTLFVLLLWFLSPGIIFRLKADRPVSAEEFLGCCGAFLRRMLQLNILAALVYGTLFGTLHRSLFDGFYDLVTRDVTVERTALLVRLSLYALFFLVVAAVNMLVDLARVQLVAGERQSTTAALLAALYVAARRTRTVTSVYALNVLTLVLVVAVFGFVAPASAGAGAKMMAAFAAGQCYIAARLAVKLSFWSGGVALTVKEVDSLQPIS
jgi:hypothetical protein